MAWLVTLSDWLVHAALVSLPIFVAGSVAVLGCRQPVRRVRLVELTLAACLAAPWLGLIPLWPQWSLSRSQPNWNIAAEITKETAVETAERSSSSSWPQPDDWPSEIGHDGSDLQTFGETMAIRLPSDAADAALGEPVLDTIPAEGQKAVWFDVRYGIAGAWLAGAAGLGLWWLAGLAGLMRLIRRSRPAPAVCRAQFREIAGPASDWVPLLQSDKIDQPFACLGLAGRPVIVLPSSFCTERTHDDPALRWCLAHEWSHVERGDLWTWTLAGVVRLLFFYQPLSWWLRRQLRLHQDYIADAQAVEQAAEPEDYAAFLTMQALYGSRRITAAGLGIGGGKSDLYRRVIMLVRNSWHVERRCPRLWAGTVSIVALGLLSAASTLRLAADAVGHLPNEFPIAQVQPEPSAVTPPAEAAADPQANPEPEAIKPQLQFLASRHRPPKMGEDDGRVPLDGIYWSPDGRLVADQDRLRPLRELFSGTYDETFEFFVFVSHPHFSSDAYGRLEVLHADGNPIHEWLAEGIQPTRTRPGTTPESAARGWRGPGWMVFHLALPESFEMPETATVRLRYTVNGGQRTPFPVETKIGDEVDDIRIVGIGDDKDGRAFVSYLVPRDRAEKFQFLIKSRPDRKVGWSLHSRRNDSQHVVAEQFQWPLKKIEEFDLWKREIEMITFQNVALSPK